MKFTSGAIVAALMACRRNIGCEVWCHSLGILVMCAACSRTGLEVGEFAPATGGSGPISGVGGETSTPDPAPTAASRRWIGVPAEDSTGQSQLLAIRLGSTKVEDVVRLDPTNRVSRDAWGDFSRRGRGIAVTVMDEAGQTNASRLWDFDTPRPTPIDLPSASNGLLNWFGPWLDEHRIVVFEAPERRRSGSRVRVSGLVPGRVQPT